MIIPRSVTQVTTDSSSLMFYIFYICSTPPQVTSVTNVNLTCTGLVWRVVPRVGVALPAVLHFSVINTDSVLADLV